MKKITLLALLSLGASLQSAMAQTAITIAAARAAAPAYNTSGTAAVTVRGVVTNGPELGVIRYLQDGTGGIAAYSPSMSNVRPGDSISVTGIIKDYKGLLEFDPVTSFTVLAGNRPLPTPVAFPASALSTAFAERYEGQLVRLNNLTSVTTTTGAPVSAFSSTTYRINGNGALTAYINAASTGAAGLIGKPSPTGVFDAIGIMSQYTNTAPGTTGYQLLPRLYADFQQGGTPNLVTAPRPTNISTTGFTVNFTTQNAGNTKLEYATSPTGTFQSVTGATNTTQHSLAITGLQPATVYYVKAISTNSVGLSESRLIPMITASNSSGKMRSYFTTAVNTALALPGNNAVYLPNGAIADTIARYINRATATLDIAIYNWNSQKILDAVNAAHTRGVAVRVLFENDNTNVSIQSLNPAIRRVGRTTAQNIMHNKFVIIDANNNNPNVPWVWTGSTNWTPGQLSVDRNNSIAIQDQSLAKVYTMEMDEMWGGGTTSTAVFGSLKTDNTPHYLNIGGKTVESWFSPTDNVNGRLIESIQTADNDLHIATMLITQSDIGRAIRDQVNLRGIANCSEVLVDDTTSSTASGSIFRTIRTAIGTRAMVNNVAGIMHHKYAIMDAGASASDPQVFVGSHNWSLSANTENDENTLIVHDARIVNQYYQEFHRRITDQNRGITPCALVLATRNGTVQNSNVQIYPNPTTGKFQLHLEAAKARTATITLRDATGRVVLTETRPLTGQDVSIDATQLRAGLYLVQIVTPESTQISRVVVE
ncbi:Por secretion system C-terminal sorting domain-containing protein [Hymenobacter daecheongensis DSM 21074]|uniref:phospholipase D n=1 Tax=Hymenobacter daecheongensis DSM 21074 TaxID=1121955 RepID=A0A1M6HX76_9BACT|nr:phospholipase D-like domain-containing protein [Hymenobacter daecheongensis]SHJ26811.1 Por secretion system C-terminal sorting domain-containing protein [Hymenobacter daecheongensis DSM 21074]